MIFSFLLICAIPAINDSIGFDPSWKENQFDQNNADTRIESPATSKLRSILKTDSSNNKHPKKHVSFSGIPEEETESSVGSPYDPEEILKDQKGYVGWILSKLGLFVPKQSNEIHEVKPASTVLDYEDEIYDRQEDIRYYMED